MAAPALKVWTSQYGDVAIPNLTPLGFQFGAAALGAAPIMGEEGNIYREVVSGRNSVAQAGDTVIGVFSLPGNSFDITGRGLNFLSQGSTANNTNAKRIKIYYGCTAAVIGSVVSGGTVIADTGNYTTTGAVGWQIEANVFKYGAAGSNTQLALHQSAQIGSVVGSLVVPTALTAVESASILIAITTTSPTAAGDTVYNFFEVNALN
jgi:hypothetical protein